MSNEVPLAVGNVERPAPPSAGDAPVRSDAGKTLERVAMWAVPLAVASPAALWPATWFALSALLAFACTTRRVAQKAGGGPAAAVVAPWQTVMRGFSSGNAVVVLRSFVIVVLSVGLASFVFGVLRGLTEFGSYAVLTCGRLELHEHGPALIAVGLAALFLRKALREGRGPSESDVFGPVAEGALAGIVLASAIVTVVLCLVPKPGALSLDSLPSVLDGPRLSAERAWADEQAQAVFRCLQDETGVDWRGRVGDEDGHLVLRVKQGSDGRRRATRDNTTGLLLALHNQLIGGVSTWVVQRVAGYAPQVVDRSQLALRERPLLDAAPFLAVTGVEPEVLPVVSDTVRTSLLCGTRLP